MKRHVNQMFFFIFLAISFLFPYVSDAQAPDSLGKAIEEILNRKNFTAGAENDMVQHDSSAIMHYLNESSRFKSFSYDSSLFYIRKALSLSFKSESQRYISLTMQSLGDYYITQDRFQDALSCYLQSLRIEMKRNENARLADLYTALGKTYYYMELYSTALEYDNKALGIFKSDNDTSGIAVVLDQIGYLNSSREFCEKRTEAEKSKDYQIAINYFEQSAKLFSIIRDEKGLAVVNQHFAAVYNKMKRPDMSLYYIRESLDYYRKINDPELISNALYVMGKTYCKLKNYEKSIQSFRESEEICLKNHLYQGIQFLYESMAEAFNYAKEYKPAYDYYIKYMTIRDSVYNSAKSKQFLELEAKYQSEVNKNEILKLMSEKRQRNSFIFILLGVIILLGSIAYCYIRIIRKNKVIADQKVKISENKILELERERVYLAARSVIEGEEAERTRLAGDLHNGLGGLLSGIKIKLSSMKENSVISNEHVNAFNHAISLLDNSICELRRIAHNLMPETLNHYGLKTAVEDFCTQLSPSGLPEISAGFFGDEIRYTKELELTIYRIIQELVNNSLKHAEASKITVQVFSEPKRLFTQVIDNGKGFEYSENLLYRGGKGLENIRNRVTSMNGKLDIWSQPGKGTEISVEIEIS